MKLYLLIILLAFQTTFSQNTAEQTAFDFFFKNIFQKEYPKVSKIQFSGYSESTFAGKIDNPDCLNEYEISALSHWNFNEADGNTRIIDKFSKKINKKSKGVKVVINVFESVIVAPKNDFIVLLKVTKKNFYSNYYYFVIDKTKVTKWCRMDYKI